MIFLSHYFQIYQELAPQNEELKSHFKDSLYVT